MQAHPPVKAAKEPVLFEHAGKQPFGQCRVDRHGKAARLDKAPRFIINGGVERAGRAQRELHHVNSNDAVECDLPLCITSQPLLFGIPREGNADFDIRPGDHVAKWGIEG